MKKIAVEEHFWSAEYADYLRTRKDFPYIKTIEDEKHDKVERLFISPDIATPLGAKLFDMGPGRIAEMEKVGIDMQVVSLSIPGIEAFDAADGITWAKKTNDELARAVEKYPDKFAGMAAIPSMAPEAAAKELERAVKKLGLKGAVINSHIRGEYMDDMKFWPIFEAAEALDVPIYIHPREPSPSIIKPYLAYPGLAMALWGFSAETGLHAIRLICSGVFDKYPKLKIMLGHLGEGIPFYLHRIDTHWKNGPLGKKLKRMAAEYVRDNLYLTTSAMFGHAAFMCTYLELGASHILFSIDYPYESSEDAARFVEGLPISVGDKEKICHLNAEELLKI